VRRRLKESESDREREERRESRPATIIFLLSTPFRIQPTTLLFPLPSSPVT